MERKIFLLMGPSGAGKTTLGGYLKELGIPELISHTTRPLRKNEVNGIHYHFVSDDEFKKLDLIESVVYDGHHYGLSKGEVEQKLALNNKVFVVAELNGAKQIKEVYPNEVVVIFITVSLQEMEKRMRERGDSEESIRKRLKRAIQNKEHEHSRFADYIIENYDLKKSKKRLREIIETETIAIS